MNIYKIFQEVNNDYDTYSSAVVVAENEEDARNMNPAGGTMDWKDGYFSCWVSSPEQVKVELIGKAAKGQDKGIVVASFHAG